VVPFRTVRWRVGLRAVVLAASLASGTAHAQDTTACINADTRGQEVRLRGHWRDAEALFRTCLHLQCPAAIAQDCTARYDDVRASMPSLLVVARRPDGADTVDARLVIDGQVVASSLPATAIEVDPGEHVVSIAHDGWIATEKRIVVREREKDRRVVFQFAPSSSEASSPEMPSPETSSSPASSAQAPAGATQQGGVDVLGVTLTVSGAAAVAVGATFVIVGFVQRSSLAASPCAATQMCSPSDVHTVDRNYWIGGVVGVVGLVVLAFGIWELVTHHEQRGAVAGAPGLLLSF
jgi:hypothetical protein